MRMTRRAVMEGRTAQTALSRDERHLAAGTGAPAGPPSSTSHAARGTGGRIALGGKAGAAVTPPTEVGMKAVVGRSSRLRDGRGGSGAGRSRKMRRKRPSVPQRRLRGGLRGL